MSATVFNGEVKKTKRYQMAERLGAARNLLLMTATPHSGKEEQFQLFMALLDSDRFEGAVREGTRRVDVSDLMRRLVKEELLRFDGTRLFPQRRSYTVQYPLSDLEKSLYLAVTDYVRDQMNLADRLKDKDNRKRVAVGFALTTLQRRQRPAPPRSTVRWNAGCTAWERATPRSTRSCATGLEVIEVPWSACTAPGAPWTAAAWAISAAASWESSRAATVHPTT